MLEPERDRRDRRDRTAMLAITIAAGLIITLVLYLAGAFMKSTG